MCKDENKREDEFKDFILKDIEENKKRTDYVGIRAKSTERSCKTGTPRQIVLNYGFMKLAEGRVTEQKRALDFLFYHIIGMLVSDEKENHCKEIEDFFSLINDDEETQGKIQKRIELLEQIGDVWQALSAENEGQKGKIEALKTSLKVLAVQEDYYGVEKMTTIRQCVNWLDGERESNKRNDMPPYNKDTLRLKIRQYLIEKRCSSHAVGGSGGTFYYVKDLAIAFQRAYGYYDAADYQANFSRFAKYRSELTDRKNKDVL